MVRIPSWMMKKKRKKMSSPRKKLKNKYRKTIPSQFSTQEGSQNVYQKVQTLSKPFMPFGDSTASSFSTTMPWNG